MASDSRLSSSETAVTEHGMDETSNGRMPGNGNAAGLSNLTLPPLWMNKERSKFRFRICVIAAIMDLGVMPIVYFYAFKYGTTLSLQDSKLLPTLAATLVDAGSFD